MPYRKSILVADDSDLDFLILHRAFAKSGTNVQLFAVKDGQEAIDYLAGEGNFHDRGTHPLPCLMLLDLKMPRLDGFDVLRWMEKQPILKKLPVTVLTSSDEDKDVDRAYGLGANSYLVKPGSMSGYEGLVTKLHEYWVKLNRAPSVASFE